MGFPWRHKKTHCKRGHLLEPSSVYVSNGCRGCKRCNKEQSNAIRARRKQRGLCPKCGVKAAPNAIQCLDCTKRSRQNQKRSRAKVKLSKDDKKKILIEMLGDECVDCGYRGHFAGFEFDHLRDKTYCISTMLSVATKWEKVLEEVKKCELVCATCHRIRTFKRLREQG